MEAGAGEKKDIWFSQTKFLRLSGGVACIWGRGSNAVRKLAKKFTVWLIIKTISTKINLFEPAQSGKMKRLAKKAIITRKIATTI